MYEIEIIFLSRGKKKERFEILVLGNAAKNYSLEENINKILLSFFFWGDIKINYEEIKNGKVILSYSSPMFVFILESPNTIG